MRKSMRQRIDHTQRRARQLAVRMRARLRKRSGQAIVEFALCATLIFFLLAAAVDLGLVFFSRLSTKSRTSFCLSMGSFRSFSNTVFSMLMVASRPSHLKPQAILQSFRRPATCPILASASQDSPKPHRPQDLRETMPLSQAALLFHPRHDSPHANAYFAPLRRVCQVDQW